MAEKEENIFDEQSFLLDFFEETIGANAGKNYKHFVQLTGDPTGVCNKIASLGASGFFKFKNHQLALLVPQVRVMKVYKKGKTDISEQEFKFDDHTTVESITSSRGRGSAAGLISFDWNDMGTNPGDSGLSFAATLKLKFQSFEALFSDRGGYKFADLVVPAGGIKVGGKKVYDDKYYQIKVIVGWAVPNDPNRKVFSTEELEMIRGLKTTFLLTLTTHDIDIKEDGSFDLTLSYMAAIEGRGLSARADLLYVDASSNVTEEITGLKKKQMQIRRLEATTRARAKSMPDEGWSPFTTTVKERTEEEAKGYEEKSKEIKEALASKQNDARTSSYGRLLEKIEGSRSLFTFNLTQEQIELYKLIAEEIGAIDKTLSSVRKAEIAVGKRKALKQEVKAAKPGGFQVATAQIKESYQSLSQLNDKLAATKGPSKEVREKQEETIKEFSEDAKKDATAETLSLNFFFFGDLINAALEILAEKKPKSGDEDQFRFLLGTIDLPASNGKLKSVPLSDIPISLNLFQDWFVKNVIKPLRDHLPFRVFIQRVTSELITAAISPHAFGPKGKSSKTRISTTTEVLSKNSLPEKGRYAISNLKKNLRQQANIKDISNLRQYLFLYVGGVLNQNLRGSRQSDEENYGIYHFYVGADQGIVKKINFKRTDLPFQRESRISNSQNETQNNLLFSDFYNADITMIGNSIFRPGLLVFIDPRSMGLGSASSANSQANLLGIGGYYMVTKVESSIESGKFETMMSLISETSIRDIQKKDSSDRVDHKRRSK